jgi:hypothetical protein
MEGVQHPGELEAAAVYDDYPVTGRKEVRQVLQRPSGKGAASDLDHHGLHVL